MAVLSRISPKIDDLGHARSPFVVCHEVKTEIGSGKQFYA